jgi:hypothetical protein
LPGRPKRDPAMLRELVRLEFSWQVIFAGMRYGIPGGAEPLNVYSIHGPTKSIVYGMPQGIELKWTKPDKLLRDTEDERKAWQRHWENHVKEADEEFTQKIVLSPPRDLPGEPELLDALMRQGTKAIQVRRICKQSKHLTPYPGVPCPTALYVHAEEFCEAKKDERYPDGGKQNRASSYDKRIDYLARVMAGLSLQKPIAPATAVDLLRKTKHKRGCACWRCTIST